MGRFEFIWRFVGQCIAGQLPSGECAPLWQFGIIILLLVFAVVGLVVVRLLTSDSLGPPAPTPPGGAGAQKRKT